MTSSGASPHDDLHVRQDGPAEAPALLLLHGSAATSRSWDAMVPLLTSHRVIRIDLPGHGRSAGPADGDYSLPALGRRLATALDRVGVRHAVVVGHSSGGYAATALAEQRPDLVRALVLINTGPRMNAFIAPPEQAAFDPAQWPPSDELVRRFASTGFRAGFQVPQVLVDELRQMSLQAVASAMRASTAYLTERALPDRLRALGKPVQVIFGDQDGRWRPSSAADYGVVPDAEIQMLSGAGHTPILEEPARTAALLLAFTRYVPCGDLDGDARIRRDE
ncbi:alpha/beta hydrolase [Streptomyces alfalfae]|uniref:Alpha/beta fold hydrolase n=1 Tax=Streptomyces alfalfae TaxID=1642299 RepID=A0A1P8TQR4_9ACTN|nr:alpha/beta fold hydrolase [Streptomyces alfalfae]AYA20449.1 alpha/beta fold hydrolase [Streptomyces fradiae]APY89989.1 alpha/beta hydrolase [Streptomyces alfalfae]QQC87511.1 alpha/beta fold hydrolase [Streptomyces alfalfae]QUI29939.1 alpha/beta fold hydrolase [Streptomyces alfalfae]RXX42814.1 alpha/beta hydrolase [Streptomyces alfalfae]